MKKKTNPRKIPVTQADVEKAKKNAQAMAINYAWAIFFSVMRDKEGYGKKRLARVWNGVNELSDSITRGYVNIKDLMRALEEESGIILE